ncbi:MAG: cell division protein FtsZ [Ferruginibacter sp.]
MIHFDLPKEQSSIIKVIGVGGGGGNAVNHMLDQKIEGVDFIICNTDAQALTLSQVPNRIQLGPHLTQGLGAGANPNIGRQATEESLEEIKKILEVNTKMAFITAGMGGGTGTGGAPIIARICKQLNILTVGIVTTPFAYEGKKRLAQAQEGIRQLKEHVDTLLVISNDKLRQQFGSLKLNEAFNRADNVLATAAKCITDVINYTGQINVDFADVCTVMRDGGVAILGSARASGINRAQEAIENALTSPLLNDNDIRGAKWILININSSKGEHEFTMDEVDIIQSHLIAQTGEDTDVIMGIGYDDTLGENIGITLIATGFEHRDPFDKSEVEKQKEIAEKVVLELESPRPDPVVVPVTRELQTETVAESTETTTIAEFEEKNSDEAAPEVWSLVLETENSPAPTDNTSTELTIESSTNPETTFDLTTPREVTVDEPSEPSVTLLSESHTDLSDEPPVFFEISGPMDQIPAVNLFFDEQEAVQPVTNMELSPTLDEDEKLAPVSAGYLSKPQNIYAEEPVAEPLQETERATVSDITIEPPVTVTPEPVFQFEVNEEPNEDTLAQITREKSEEPAIRMDAIRDDSDEALRRRAAERIAKLRQLSFNVNTSDPNSEFDTVPAYMRRNAEAQVQIADVESFYSHYRVKPAENNQVDISTLNTFLEGKKPD